MRNTRNCLCNGYKKFHLIREFFTVILLLTAGLCFGLSDKFVMIDGGAFMMGSPPSERGRFSNEFQRQVTVSSFYIGIHEVTQEEYQALMEANPSYFKGPTLPVEQVTWFNAIEFCNRMSSKEGLTPAYTVNGRNVQWDRDANGYRLPTEAEWEYACRGGTSTPFHTGNSINASQANFDGTRPYNNGPRSTYRERTLPVGSLPPNSLGLHDMHGNVGEWCWDWHAEYSRGELIDPPGGSFGIYRVFRGGSWNHSADILRSARRSGLDPTNRGYYLGFRLAKNAD